MKLLTIVLSLLPPLSSLLFAQEERTVTAARAYVERHEAEILAELRSFLAIPNLAGDRENIGRNARAIAEMLRRRGVTPRLMEVPGAPPAVYGELLVPRATKTIVFYAHYDGQPVEPRDWSSDPWVPVLRKEGRDIPFPAPGSRVDGEARIYARSASDDKAPIIALMVALDALRASRIQPTVNLKFFFDGEEEAGSPHLRQILQENSEALAADLWLICDGPVHQSREMQVYFGVRGVMGLEMTVYGASRSLHSGHYGNWTPNPIAVLANVLAGMRSPDGQILIDGFYDDVRPLNEAERRAIAAVPPVEEGLKEELSLALVESDALLPERIAMPALNFQGIRSGEVGAKSTNSIPTSATVAIDFRLVPNLTPRRVREVVEAHLTRKGHHIVHREPDAATRRKHGRLIWLDWGGGYPAARTALDHPTATSVIRAIESATGPGLIQMPTLGGSVPMHLFEDVLHTSAIGVPTVNHDNNQHAANENLRLQNLWDAIPIFAAIMRM